MAPDARPPLPDTTTADVPDIETVARAMGMAYTALESVNADPTWLARFPARLLMDHEILPFEQKDGVVRVAVAQAEKAAPALQRLRALTGLDFEPVLAPRDALRRELKQRLGVGADTLQSLETANEFQWVREERGEEADLEQAAGDASIIRFVNQVLADAISLRATDIHIEPFEDELRIRYRVDGVLQEAPVPPRLKRFQPAIVSRIKILSGLNIAEKRLPQDGRIRVRVRGGELDVRISIIPMIHGEAVVLRLLRRDAQLMRLDDLGLAPRERAILDRLLTLPHGIVLITGPTGSGKTTTLYSALNEINDVGRKIVTIEDPVEYQLRGVNQIQVNEKAGLTFARGLRSILRHDPDVVLVGEIRDRETAAIAVQASLTGHLVFSTLHTNDAPSAPVRLIDMGVEPYLIASSMEAALAQRLVRLLCPRCRQPDDSDRAEALRERFPELRGVPLHRAMGCEACRHTGYYGRRAIFEAMPVTPALRRLILANAPGGEIREQARREGMTSLLEDGWRLVRLGVTTVDEVLRVSKDERMNDFGPVEPETQTGTEKA